MIRHPEHYRFPCYLEAATYRGWDFYRYYPEFSDFQEAYLKPIYTKLGYNEEIQNHILRDTYFRKWLELPGQLMLDEQEGQPCKLLAALLNRAEEQMIRPHSDPDSWQIWDCQASQCTTALCADRRFGEGKYRAIAEGISEIICTYLDPTQEQKQFAMDTYILCNLY